MDSLHRRGPDCPLPCLVDAPAVRSLNQLSSDDMQRATMNPCGCLVKIIGKRSQFVATSAEPSHRVRTSAGYASHEAICPAFCPLSFTPSFCEAPKNGMYRQRTARVQASGHAHDAHWMIKRRIIKRRRAENARTPLLHLRPEFDSRCKWFWICGTRVYCTLASA